jgi:hypothetical protein
VSELILCGKAWKKEEKEILYITTLSCGEENQDLLKNKSRCLLDLK